MIALFSMLACTAADAPLPPRVDWQARVRWAEVTAAAEVPIATLPAEVSPPPGGRVSLAPPVHARLVAWRVQPGQAIEAGEVLAELRAPALVEADTRVIEARAVLAEAERAVALATESVERGVAARAELLQAEASQATAAARLSAAQRQRSAWQDSTTSKGNSQLWTSPTRGVVETLHCQLQPVGPETPCVDLVQPDGATVRVGVPERLVGSVDLRATATATFGALRGEALSVQALSPAIDPETRVQWAWFVAPPAPMGSRGRATVWMPSDDAVVLPSSALVAEGAGHRVFLRGEDPPRAVPVEVLGRGEDVRYVRGIEPGAEVAVTGVFLLKSLAVLGAS